MVSVSSNGIVIPWRRLSCQEFISYSRFANDGYHLDVLIEDEVFLRCVLDDSLRRRINTLPAGVITSVVSQIFQASTANSADHLNILLNETRQSVLGANNAIVHHLVKWITMAFSYKPDEVYAMDFPQLLRIFVLAENKLLELGMIDKPFMAQQQQTEEEEQQPSEQQQEEPPLKVDPREVWEKVHGIQPPTTEQEERDERQREAMLQKFTIFNKPEFQHPFREHEEEKLIAKAKGYKPSRWRQYQTELNKQKPKKRSSILPPPEEVPKEIMDDPHVSPIIKYGGASNAKRVDFAVDEIGVLRGLANHDLVDLDINRQLMIKDAQKMYAPVLKYLDEQRAKAPSKETSKRKV